MSATETAVPVCSEKNICLNVLENSPEKIYNKVIFRQKICQLTFKGVNLYSSFPECFNTALLLDNCIKNKFKIIFKEYQSLGLREPNAAFFFNWIKLNMVSFFNGDSVFCTNKLPVDLKYFSRLLIFAVKKYTEFEFSKKAKQ